MNTSGARPSAPPPAALAAVAEEALRALFRRVAGAADIESVEDTDELHAVLGSLTLVVEHLARCLPELSDWMEQQLWSGQLGSADCFEDVTKSTFEVSAALARANRLSTQLSRELRLAQSATGDPASQ
ncbi:hypothetical protein ABZ639_14050 [Saccharomonospora sp. NPDC006951]